MASKKQRAIAAASGRSCHSWSSDIPSELITVIAQHLQRVVDLKRCATVCKTWWQAIVPARVQPGHSEMPWTISWNHPGDFRNPSTGFSSFWSNCHTSLYQTKTLEPGRKLFLDGDFCASKHGWLLLSSAVENSNGTTSFTYFFYNPFCNKTIQEVPELNWPNGRRMLITTFEVAPTSPNCVIFVMDIEESGSYMLNTCKLRDTEWSRHRIGRPFSTHASRQDVIYTEGSFYLVLGGTNVPLCVAKFSVALQEWTVIEDCSSSFLNVNSEFYDEFRSSFKLLECKGEVLLVAVNMYNDDSRIHIIGFDWSQKVSTAVKSLGERVLFWSPLVTFAVPALGDSAVFANMIFWRSKKIECRYVYESEGIWRRSIRQILSDWDVDTWIEPLDLWG